MSCAECAHGGPQRRPDVALDVIAGGSRARQVDLGEMASRAVRRIRQMDLVGVDDLFVLLPGR